MKSGQHSVKAEIIADFVANCIFVEQLVLKIPRSNQKTLLTWW